MPLRPTPRCSFCGKGKDQVTRLVAGPGVYICDQCVALCNEVIAQGPSSPPAETSGGGRWVAKIVARLKKPRRGLSRSAARPAG